MTRTPHGERESHANIVKTRAAEEGNEDPNPEHRINLHHQSTFNIKPTLLIFFTLYLFYLYK